MTNSIKITKEERAALIAQLAIVCPGQKLGRKSSVDLLDILAKALGDAPQNMSAILAKYRPHYIVSTTPNGRKSRCNGDDVAAELEGYDALQVIKAAEILCELETGTLVAKYQGMNPGQARMNAGNRIRGAVRRGDIEADEIAAAINS